MFKQDDLKKKYELDIFAQLIEDCEDSIISVLDSNKSKESSEFRNYLLYTVGKCFVTCREIIILCWSGYPDGALALSRNIYEQFVITFYLYDQVINKNNKSILDKYFDDYDYQRARNLKFEAEKIQNDELKAVQYKETIKRLKVKYNLKDMHDYWWLDEKRKNFSALCDYVCINNSDMSEFLRNMQLLYKRACLSVHASYMGNKIRIGSDFDGIDVGPWDRGQENALFLSVASMIYILGIVSEVIGVPIKKEINELDKLAEKYIKKMKTKK
ncbi:MAG: hypothetical protein II838_13350 [Lachnospiraceae bacterium]|nr:hypothetical protein [Lachnospiraceae bacterium]